MNTIKILFAKFYNSLPSKIKIAIYVTTSFLLAGFLTLIIKDIANLEINNQYIRLILDAVVFFLGVVLNIMQYQFTEAGTKFLAEEGDPKTLDQLRKKIIKNQRIKNLPYNNQ